MRRDPIMIRGPRPVRGPARGRGGFTLMELLIGILIIGLLLSLLVVAGRSALRAGRGAAASQTVGALKIAVDQFKSEFGFLPPLVMDENPGLAPAFPGYPTYAVGGPPPSRRAAVFNFSLDNSNRDHREYLRGVGLSPDGPRGNADRRFSTFSLSYYLGGLADVPVPTNPPTVMDGVEGPEMLTPGSDGTFARASGGRLGKKYGAFMDLGKGGLKTLDLDASEGQARTGRVELRDSRGIAIRYYRWLPGRPNSTTTDLTLNGQFQAAWTNIPGLVDDWQGRGDDAPNPAFRDAGYAIVAAGADGVFGDFALEGDGDAAKYASLCRDVGLPPDATPTQFRRKASADNAVEVGR